MTKTSDYVFLFQVIFQQKRDIFAYFCLYSQIFYDIVFNKQNPTYLEFYLKSKGSFLHKPFLHDFRHFQVQKRAFHCIMQDNRLGSGLDGGVLGFVCRVKLSVSWHAPFWRGAIAMHFAAIFGAAPVIRRRPRKGRHF